LVRLQGELADPLAGRREDRVGEWAKGFAEARVLGPVLPHERLTLRAVWEKYVEAEFPHLRLKTQTLYTGYWQKWELSGASSST
jgi:hypothetical protein